MPFARLHAEHIILSYGVQLRGGGFKGLGTASIEEINRLSNNKKAWKNWLAMHYTLCTDPEVVGMSAHVLLVARKLRD